MGSRNDPPHRQALAAGLLAAATACTAALALLVGGPGATEAEAAQATAPAATQRSDTAHIDRSLIRALSRGSATNNGSLTASWHPGGELKAIGQTLIRESSLPPAIKPA
ncbi:hypothetical protein [Streptomyces sp. NPDC048442]|uniref:hypothetical protein n=1 Tax=Streptomyces sp. NPDC048442 TaxID=3154823 RepID=UPI00342C87B6